MGFPKDILFNRMKCKDISINITIWEIVVYEDKVANNFVSGTFWEVTYLNSKLAQIVALLKWRGYSSG